MSMNIAIEGFVNQITIGLLPHILEQMEETRKN